MHSILLQILQGNWYIDPDFAKSAGFLISQILKGRIAFDGDSEKFKPTTHSYSISADGSAGSSKKQSAIISISGPLTKHDQYCGPAGMDTIGQWIREFNRDHPDIVSIILRLSTPGGTVEGTAQLGEEIKNSSKPVIAYIDEMACSGGYWLASQCDEIIAATPRARVGSIGVMLAFADVQPAWEKEGVVFHEVYSKHSPDKNKDWKELREKNYDNYRSDVLDPLAEDFISIVKSTREISDESIFKGRVVFASDAVNIGLVDSIGTLDMAVQRSFELAEKKDQENASSSNPNINSETKNLIKMEKLPLLVALLAVGALESTEEGIHLNQEQLEKIEAALAQLGQQDESVTELQGQIETLNGTITERDNRISELETEVSEVRAAAGADPATVISKGEKEQVDDLDPMVAEMNATDDTAERIEILRKYGYA